MAGKGATMVFMYEGALCTNGFSPFALLPCIGTGFFFSIHGFYPRSSQRVKDGGEMGHERRSWAAIVASLGSSMLAIKHQ